MLIQILIANCEHIKLESWYNNNYYRLPFMVNGYNVLYEEYDGGEEFCGNSIGDFVDGKFIAAFFLHREDNSDYFLIDSETIDTKNKWT